ncbi:hypothetical protein B0H17DRAFT_1142137 [Mycena rosella]|uniref:Uncharacterized protein n=1 Tax=Mycena rosella TaxID=1033263 RepID=A0AAD7CY07_MYCRO|nr:hypothetical protein B0H17DRAFT_1142137 [Mycena rosella]
MRASTETSMSPSLGVVVRSRMGTDAVIGGRRLGTVRFAGECLNFKPLESRLLICLLSATEEYADAACAHTFSSAASRPNSTARRSSSASLSNDRRHGPPTQIFTTVAGQLVCVRAARVICTWTALDIAPRTPLAERFRREEGGGRRTLANISSKKGIKGSRRGGEGIIG